MWIKLLKDLIVEAVVDRFQRIPAGSILWCRRSALVKREGTAYKQWASTQTVEVNGLVCVFSDEAEHDLYEECAEPPANYRPSIENAA